MVQRQPQDGPHPAAAQQSGSLHAIVAGRSRRAPDRDADGILRTRKVHAPLYAARKGAEQADGEQHGQNDVRGRQRGVARQRRGADDLRQGRFHKLRLRPEKHPFAPQQHRLVDLQGPEQHRLAGHRRGHRLLRCGRALVHQLRPLGSRRQSVRGHLGIRRSDGPYGPSVARIAVRAVGLRAGAEPDAVDQPFERGGRHLQLRQRPFDRRQRHSVDRDGRGTGLLRHPAEPGGADPVAPAQPAQVHLCRDAGLRRQNVRQRRDGTDAGHRLRLRRLDPAVRYRNGQSGTHGRADRIDGRG